MRDRLRVGVVNFQTAWGAIPENLTRIERICRKAKEQGAELVVFPEVAVSGYSIFERGAMQKDAQSRFRALAARSSAKLPKSWSFILPLGCSSAMG